MAELGSIIVATAQIAKSRLDNAGAQFVSTVGGVSYYSHSGGQRFVAVERVAQGFRMTENDADCGCGGSRKTK